MQVSVTQQMLEEQMCWKFRSTTFADFHLGDEDDGPIYSPVSPDPNSSSGEDYDDIGAI